MRVFFTWVVQPSRFRFEVGQRGRFESAPSQFLTGVGYSQESTDDAGHIGEKVAAA